MASEGRKASRCSAEGFRPARKKKKKKAAHELGDDALGVVSLHLCDEALRHVARRLDAVGQASLLLHLQNALHAASASQPVPLIDSTLMAVLCGDNKAIWFSGVPRANFIKAWYHRMGMDISNNTNRKLVAIEPAATCSTQ